MRLSNSVQSIVHAIYKLLMLTIEDYLLKNVNNVPVRYYMFGHDEETGVENENWSSLSAGMLTLFTYVTVRTT